MHRHGDLFKADAPDDEWLERVGREGWTAVTHDGRIRYKPNELQAVVRHNVGLLVVIGKAPFPVIARHFVNTLPKIQSFVAAQSGPFIAKVYRPLPTELATDPNAPGSVSLWSPR